MINSNLSKQLKGITKYAQLNDLPNWTGYLIACHQDNTPPPPPLPNNLYPCHTWFSEVTLKCQLWEGALELNPHLHNAQHIEMLQQGKMKELF